MRLPSLSKRFRLVHAQKDYAHVAFPRSCELSCQAVSLNVSLNEVAEPSLASTLGGRLCCTCPQHQSKSLDALPVSKNYLHPPFNCHVWQFYVACRTAVDIQDAYKLLSPTLGVKAASVIFALALLASGQNSTITGTLAGQVVMEGAIVVS